MRLRKRRRRTSSRFCRCHSESARNSRHHASPVTALPRRRAPRSIPHDERERRLRHSLRGREQRAPRTGPRRRGWTLRERHDRGSTWPPRPSCPMRRGGGPPSESRQASRDRMRSELERALAVGSGGWTPLCRGLWPLRGGGGHRLVEACGLFEGEVDTALSRPAASRAGCRRAFPTARQASERVSRAKSAGPRGSWRGGHPLPRPRRGTRQGGHQGSRDGPRERRRGGQLPRNGVRPIAARLRNGARLSPAAPS